MNSLRFSRQFFSYFKSAPKSSWYKIPALVGLSTCGALVLGSITSERVIYDELPSSNTRRLLPSSIIAHCADSGSVGQDFNMLGFSSTRVFFTPRDSKGGVGKLQLVAAGMRRKNLYIVEVDVYKVGIYLSEAQDKAMKNKAAASKGAELDISSAVVGQKGTSVAIVLNFVRAIARKTIVDATVEALSSPQLQQDEDYQKALASFAKLLNEGIEEQGMKVGDEMVLTFFGDDASQVGVVVGNTLCGTIANQQLRKRLADVYAGDKSIAQGVSKQLKLRFSASSAV